MKPILILQHLSLDAPAYLREWLDREGRAYDVFDTERGEAFPGARMGPPPESDPVSRESAASLALRVSQPPAVSVCTPVLRRRQGS